MDTSCSFLTAVKVSKNKNLMEFTLKEVANLLWYNFNSLSFEDLSVLSGGGYCECCGSWPVGLSGPKGDVRTD
jgi:hypothetical protein